MFAFDLLKESDSFKMLNPFLHVGPMVFREVHVENTWKICLEGIFWCFLCKLVASLRNSQLQTLKLWLQSGF